MHTKNRFFMYGVIYTSASGQTVAKNYGKVMNEGLHPTLQGLKRIVQELNVGAKDVVITGLYEFQTEQEFIEFWNL